MPADVTEGVWEGRRVALLQAVYDRIEPCAHHTLFWAYAKYGPEKIALLPPVEHTCIWKARNWLLNEFMKTEADYAIFVDLDMAFPCGFQSVLAKYGWTGNPELGGVNFIGRLMSHGPEWGIVGGLYFGRNPNGRALCASGFDSLGEDKKIRENLGSGLRKERWVPTGCMRISRWAVEKLIEAAPSKWPNVVPSDGGPFGFFNPLGYGDGEDIAFCSRMNELGIPIALDTSIVCMHKGHAYYGPTNTNPA